MIYPDAEKMHGDNSLIAEAKCSNFE